MKVELIKLIEKKYFNVHIEYWRRNPSEEGTYMISLYSKDGKYIGNPKEMGEFFSKYDIKEDLSTIDETSKTISVGYSPRDNKYYGWARAVCGFGIGSRVKRGDIAYVPSNPEEIIEAEKEYYSKYYKNVEFFVEDNYVIIRGIEEFCDDNWVSLPSGELKHVGKMEDRPFEHKIRLGKGEWEAKTIEDAKQMAKDFASGCA